VKYGFIRDHKNTYRIALLCRVLEVSSRGYYDWFTRSDSNRKIENTLLLKEIKQIFKANREVYGAPRIYKELLDKGYQCSLNRVARLMRQAGIVPKTIKKFRITTDSRKSRFPAKNLLEQDFSAEQCDEKWVADVTYIPTREGWLFLAAVLDLYSRRIIGWSMSARLTSKLAQDALQNAINLRQPDNKVIVHSDRGKEYYASEYQTLLSSHDLTCSMSRKGNCYDNATMESFFHSLKVEQVHHDDYRTRQEARSVIFDYIEVFYNRQRRHSSLGYQSPISFEEKCVA
jgi:transposase InsO family protein